MWGVPFVWRAAFLDLLRLGGGHTLRADGSKCDLTGVHEKKYSTPATPRDQRDTYSRRATTYVFVAPDFNRRAGSIGEFVGAGFSRTLDGVSYTRDRGSGTDQRTIPCADSTPWHPLGQAFRHQYHYRTRLHIEEAASPVPRVLRNLECFVRNVSRHPIRVKDPQPSRLDMKLPPTILQRYIGRIFGGPADSLDSTA